MIPDDPFIFNGYGSPRNFDDHEVRLCHLLQRDAKSALESGRRLLSVCPVCKHPWYTVGVQEYPRLTPEQLACLGAILHVDIHAHHLLPRGLCPICSTMYLGGMFSVEEYGPRKGYRFHWKSASPPHRELLALICPRDGLALDALVQMVAKPLVESTRELRSVLDWLETCPPSGTMRALQRDQCQHLARRYPPDNLVGGRLQPWRGYAWHTPCPPLGGDALVTLAVADQLPAHPPFVRLLLSWSILSRAMRAVL